MDFLYSLFNYLLLLLCLDSWNIAGVLSNNLCNDPSRYELVKTSLGEICGEIFVLGDGSTGSRFLGIPYAKPPTGKLRFAVSNFM